MDEKLIVDGLVEDGNKVQSIAQKPVQVNGLDKESPSDGIYLCPECGRTSTNRSGTVGSMEGWNASCVTNSILVKKDSLSFNPTSGRVIAADTYENKVG